MPRKIVERALRSLPLLLIPVVLTPALVLFAFPSGPAIYESSATIWVPDPEGIHQAALGINDPYATPAQRQVRVFNDLLLTRAYRAQVAEQAGLLDNASLTASGAAGAPADTSPDMRIARDEQLQALGESVSVIATGTTLITVIARHETPETAQAIATAVIDQYQERAASESTRQNEIGVEYFTEQLSVAEQELETRRAELSAYLMEHPEVGPTSIDPRYEALQARVNSAQTIAEELQVALQDRYLEAASSSQSLAARFSVQDPPELPVRPIAASLIGQFGYPAAALAFGAFLSTSYLYLAYRTDHKVRSSEDLESLDVPLLGYLPRMNGRKQGPWRNRLALRDRNFARRVAASIGRGRSTA